MKMVHLVLGQFMNLRLNPMVSIMLVVITVRTALSGNAIALTGLCAAFLPFFSQTKNVTCFAVEVSEEKEIISRYLMSYLLMIIGLVYLKAVTTLGSLYVPGYVENPLLRETFALTLVCNLVFISVLVPLTYALNVIQRFMIGSILALAELAFMLFAKYALTVMGSQFVLLEQWGLYALIILIPVTALQFIKINGLVQQQYEHVSEP